MAPQLRALAALSENPGSIPSSHLSVKNNLFKKLFFKIIK